MLHEPTDDDNIRAAIGDVEPLRAISGERSQDTVSDNMDPTTLTLSSSPPQPPSSEQIEQTPTTTHYPTPPPSPSSRSATRRAPGRGRRYRFDKSADLTLVKCVSLEGAHIAKWGQTDAMFENVYRTFYERTADSLFEASTKPTKKTLIDRYRRLMQKRKETVARNEASTGIAEGTTEADEIIDDMLLQCKEMEESRNLEAEQLQEREVELLRSEETIRQSAIKTDRE